MADQTKVPEKPLGDEQLWQLALANLTRAETSAHVLRAVLFFAALIVIALVLLQMKPGELGQPFLVNGASVVFSLFTVFCLVKSWQLQKEKAIERFKFLKAKDQDAIAIYNGVSDQLQGLQSRFWDWLAFWAFACAILIQIAVRMLSVVVVTPPPTLPM